MFGGKKVTNSEALPKLEERARVVNQEGLQEHQQKAMAKAEALPKSTERARVANQEGMQDQHRQKAMWRS